MTRQEALHKVCELDWQVWAAIHSGKRGDLGRAVRRRQNFYQRLPLALRKAVEQAQQRRARRDAKAMGLPLLTPSDGVKVR